MTISSGFWEVLLEMEMRGQPDVRHVKAEDVGNGREGTYICSSGLLPGVMWERTLERR